MAMFKKAGIVGTGLLGGSLGMALKQNGLADKVVGTSRHRTTISSACRIKAIDAGSTDLKILKGCDLVVLSAPVETILSQMPGISRILDPDCIVIDVASTKKEVVLKAHRLFPKFVGCHPIAGSDRRGIEYAQADLFDKALCIITPLKSTDADALTTIKKMWWKVGSTVCTLTPEGHDTALAWMSHLPHVLAFALMQCAPQKYLELAPRSFCDMTRIASSSPEIWDDIFMTNRKNLIRSIDAYVSTIGKFRAFIAKGDNSGLNRMMRSASLKRRSL